ncbi:ubiquinone biosynthesis protein COQ9 [Microdochium trichocladiopsis]|uniref:Ubiquinone biosynthesis protein n=1 Tax=Microdochium trichocladiopsis TaxID=1682393 RepID=A0A9P8Y484_9PEZI|nr:ubiquinone biosynthesis protein COQ9 [Microdochium trichocladiopsis]KAH7029371.1 ubiquinone biosynthesis protein COQ9 [Microdochium trichocladiopsis]
MTTRAVQSRLHCVAAPRRYHSYDHPPPPPIFSAAESAILSAAYAHVPEHGFTQRALSLGARTAGYPDISISVLPEGVFSLIKYHLVTAREGLAPRKVSVLGGTENSQLIPIPERVELLTWERLQANGAVNHRWQEALAIMAQPSNIPGALHELALLVDEIYHLSGDTSVDPSWYTKRGALSLVYTSTELFMTNDRSPGFQETRAFLQRRLNESDSLGWAFGSVRQWVGFTASAGVNVLRSKGVRI